MELLLRKTHETVNLARVSVYRFESGHRCNGDVEELNDLNSFNYSLPALIIILLTT